jgi:hypothetical protein
VKVVKKIFLLLIILVIIVVIFSYIDYFIVKTKNTFPKVSIKVIDKEKNMITYNAIFYKVWYCTADKTIRMGDYGDPQPSCSDAYSFINGYYINASGTKIPQRDILIMTEKNIYTREMIDIMTETDVKNAVYVAENYEKTLYKVLDSKKGKIKGESKEHSLVLFPTFKKFKDTYKWVYDESNLEEYYCMSENDKGEKTFSKYTDGYCENMFNTLNFDEKWCSLYKNSTLVYNEKKTSDFCEN